jgi:metal-sulfur cluster biosynthetic enzyme
MITKEQVYEALHECYDPEIPVNIVDLGLVYGMIAADAKEKIMAIEGVNDATVDLVWEPAWNPSMIAEEAKQRLGIV